MALRVRVSSLGAPLRQLCGVADGDLKTNSMSANYFIANSRCQVTRGPGELNVLESGNLEPTWSQTAQTLPATTVASPTVF